MTGPTIAPYGRVARRVALEALSAEFHYYLEQAHINGWKPNCIGKPDVFTPERPATQEQAQAACAGCPMLEAVCRPYAVALKPRGVILGGISWGDDGKPAKLDDLAEPESLAG